MSKGKVIVTGGMGYIGSHTVVELINAGYEPIIVDNLSNSNEDVLKGIKAITGIDLSFHNFDLSDEHKCSAFFNDFNDAVAVIHFAAFKSVNESVEKPLLYYKNNLHSLNNVIAGMMANGIKNMIFSSSCTVYGQPDSLPVTEKASFQPPSSPYGHTKQIGEKILKQHTEANSDSFTNISLRYFNPIGAHSTGYIGEIPQGVPNNLLPYITQTAYGIREQLSVFGGDYNTKDGTAIRDFIHVVDLAKAHVIACDRLINEKNLTAYETFNLGTGIGYTVLEAIESFAKMSGIQINFKIVGRRAGDIESIYADTTYAKEELGWETKLTLDDMTGSAWKWEQYLRSQKTNQS